MAATYTYLLADLRTNAILAELPLDPEQGFETKLSGYGQFACSLNLKAKGLAGLNLPGVLKGGRSALYIDREGVLVWGGILWRGRRAQAEHRVRLQFMEFESYFHRRLIIADYKPTATDQFTIARQLITTAQARTGGDIGVNVGSGLSGIVRDREYLRSSLPRVGEMLRELSEVENGFDFYISVAWSGDVPTKTLQLGYPRLGRGASASGLVFESPGNIVEWNDEWDAFSDSATDYYAVGEGEGPSTLIGLAQRPAAITAGYPVLESKDLDHRTVNQQTTINAHAVEDLMAAPIPVEVKGCRVKADADPVIGSYIPGDAARFVLADDDWYTPDSSGDPTFDQYMRIVGWTVDPTSDTVELTLGQERT